MKTVMIAIVSHTTVSLLSKSLYFTAVPSNTSEHWSASPCSEDHTESYRVHHILTPTDRWKEENNPFDVQRSPFLASITVSFRNPGTYLMCFRRPLIAIPGDGKKSGGAIRTIR